MLASKFLFLPFLLPLTDDRLFARPFLARENDVEDEVGSRLLLDLGLVDLRNDSLSVVLGMSHLNPI